MAGRRRRKTAEQDSDYDGAWKEVLRQYLRQILEMYLPAIAAAIDWRHPPQWSDKELGRILRQRRRRPKSVDMLVKVRLLSGAEQWILLHLEIQSSREAGFEFRIFRYNSGLVWVYGQRVVTAVILADLDESWRPEEDIFRLADFETRLRFPVCKLIDKLDSDWRDDHSLPVQVARAQIAALRTAGDPTGRYRAKWRLVRNLYNVGYNADELREIFRLIDWMMSLPEDLSRKFEEELVVLEESLDMPYVTSVERIAEERGKQEGAQSVLLGQLARICGPLPDDMRQRLNRLPLEQLEELGETLLDFRSLDDLRAWLDSHEQSTGG
jgi:hypothetical protein